MPAHDAAEHSFRSSLRDNRGARAWRLCLPGTAQPRLFVAVLIELAHIVGIEPGAGVGKPFRVDIGEIEPQPVLLCELVGAEDHGSGLVLDHRRYGPSGN